MKKILTNSFARQFISYFGVGGASAIVEWIMFTVIEYSFELPYLIATALAFLVSTTMNWILGRTFTFRDSGYQDKRIRELLLVFLVSAIGLAGNMLLMVFFVEVLGMQTSLLKVAAKILSTGIVFLWNFLSRKFLIYRV